MITKDTLLQVIYEQRRIPSEDVIRRNIDSNLLMAPEIIVITGVRRCNFMIKIFISTLMMSVC